MTIFKAAKGNILQMYSYSSKGFQRNSAKIKMQCKIFLKMSDKISQLCFQGTRESAVVKILGEKA